MHNRCRRLSLLFLAVTSGCVTDSPTYDGPPNTQAANARINFGLTGPPGDRGWTVLVDGTAVPSCTVSVYLCGDIELKPGKHHLHITREQMVQCGVFEKCNAEINPLTILGATRGMWFSQNVALKGDINMVALPGHRYTLTPLYISNQPGLSYHLDDTTIGSRLETGTFPMVPQ